MAQGQCWASRSRRRRLPRGRVTPSPAVGYRPERAAHPRIKRPVRLPGESCFRRLPRTRAPPTLGRITRPWPGGTLQMS